MTDPMNGIDLDATTEVRAALRGPETSGAVSTVDAGGTAIRAGAGADAPAPEPDLCGCGHTRIDHTFADLGECFSCPNGTCHGPYLEQLTWTEEHARQEIRHLRESESESESVRAKMADLLSRTAIALNGPEPELTMWSWHDLPEKADAALRAIAAVRDDATVEAMAEAISENACSHVYPQWDDCHECEAVARAAHAAALARLDSAQGES